MKLDAKRIGIITALIAIMLAGAGIVAGLSGQAPITYNSISNVIGLGYNSLNFTLDSQNSLTLLHPLCNKCQAQITAANGLILFPNNELDLIHLTAGGNIVISGGAGNVITAIVGSAGTTYSAGNGLLLSPTNAFSTWAAVPFTGNIATFTPLIANTLNVNTIISGNIFSSITANTITGNTLLYDDIAPFDGFSNVTGNFFTFNVIAPLTASGKITTNTLTANFINGNALLGTCASCVQNGNSAIAGTGLSSSISGSQTTLSLVALTGTAFIGISSTNTIAWLGTANSIFVTTLTANTINALSFLQANALTNFKLGNGNANTLTANTATITTLTVTTCTGCGGSGSEGNDQLVTYNSITTSNSLAYADEPSINYNSLFPLSGNTQTTIITNTLTANIIQYGAPTWTTFAVPASGTTFENTANSLEVLYLIANAPLKAPATAQTFLWNANILYIATGNTNFNVMNFNFPALPSTSSAVAGSTALPAIYLPIGSNTEFVYSATTGLTGTMEVFR